jgi:hypothetical protein
MAESLDTEQNLKNRALKRIVWLMTVFRLVAPYRRIAF